MDQMIPVVDYIRAFQELKSDGGRVVASSIVGPPAAEACDGTWYGSRYDTFSQKAADGLTENVCESDYGTIMEDLGERLIGSTRVFYLDYFAVSDSIFVWIDGEELERSDTHGWNYDSEVAAIRFDGTYVPESVAKSKFTTTFWIESILTDRSGIRPHPKPRPRIVSANVWQPPDCDRWTRGQMAIVPSLLPNSMNSVLHPVRDESTARSETHHSIP